MTPVLKNIRRLLAAKDYAGLEALLAGAAVSELAALWPELEPMERLVAFKVMDAPRALELYEALPFDHRYFLLCGFPLQSIAPVIAALPPAGRRPFVQLPRDYYDRMFRGLL